MDLSNIILNNIIDFMGLINDYENLKSFLNSN